jgi:hypothetical protein
MHKDDMFYMLHNKLITDIVNTIQEVEELRLETDKQMNKINNLLNQLKDHTRQLREADHEQQQQEGRTQQAL